MVNIFKKIYKLYTILTNQRLESHIESIEELKSFKSYGCENTHISLYTNNLDYVLSNGIPYRLRHFMTNKITDYSLFENPHEILITLLKEHKSKLNLHSQISSLLKNNNPKILDIIFDLISDLNYLHNDRLNYYYLEYLCMRDDDRIIDFISNNLEYMNESAWNALCSNPNKKAFELLIKHNKLDITDHLCFKYLCSNPNDEVIDLIMHHLYRFDDNDEYILSLCLNPNPRIIKILGLKASLTKNNNYLNLLLNPNTKIIEYALEWYVLSDIENLDYLTLLALCRNTNNKALDIVSKNIHQLDKYMFSELLCNHNSKALQILLEIEPNITVDTTINKRIFSNPNIWTYDYEKMKQIKMKLHNELNYVFMKLKKDYLFE